MKQAQVTTWGENPKYVDVPEPPAPADGQVQIKVLAAGVHQLVRSRAAGKHYSAQGLPHIPGTDGVGKTVPEGKLVYFSAMTPQGGSFTDIINVPAAAVAPIAAHADPVQVAGLTNPVMASWMAIKLRTRDLPPNFTTVILGATGVSGTAAISVSRLLGAGKVIGAGRTTSKLEGLDLDATVKLEDDATKTDFSAAADADLILDFVYGPQVVELFKALPNQKPVQYVQVGTVGSLEVDFPGALLRSKDITMRGTGPGAFRMPQFFAEVPAIAAAIADKKVTPGKFKMVQLKDIDSFWGEKGGERLVVTI